MTNLFRFSHEQNLDKIIILHITVKSWVVTPEISRTLPQKHSYQHIASHPVSLTPSLGWSSFHFYLVKEEPVGTGRTCPPCRSLKLPFTIRYMSCPLDTCSLGLGAYGHWSGCNRWQILTVKALGKLVMGRTDSWQLLDGALLRTKPKLIRESLLTSPHLHQLAFSPCWFVSHCSPRRPLTASTRLFPASGMLPMPCMAFLLLAILQPQLSSGLPLSHSLVILLQSFSHLPPSCRYY